MKNQSNKTEPIIFRPTKSFYIQYAFITIFYLAICIGQLSLTSRHHIITFISIIPVIIIFITSFYLHYKIENNTLYIKGLLGNKSVLIDNITEVKPVYKKDGSIKNVRIDFQNGNYKSFWVLKHIRPELITYLNNCICKTNISE